ncbi:MAG: S-adenosyl-L-methionine-dependent methyltransferase [Linnemannia elongata]|nr:MAG: S-adenosyl-L-methionine-dependent methyltransferase [Linnemannia elongata]
MSASTPTILPLSLEHLTNQQVDRDSPETLKPSKLALGHQNYHQISSALPSPDDSESDEAEGGTSSRTTTSNNNTNDTICHGRVKNPEAMVSKTWWKNVFSDQLYLQTDGDVVEDPAITLEEVRLLESVTAIRDILQASVDSSPSGRTIKVLDLCCGQGRHILQLAELYPALELYGHDQSEFLIHLARSRAAAATKDDVPLTTPPTTTNKKGAQIQFTIGDCRSIPFSDSTFDLVLVMGNSFGYFSNDKDDENLLTQIHRVLRPGGIVVLDITDGAYQRENYSPRGWEWVDDEMLVCRERWLSEDKKRLVCREVVIKTTQGVIRDQFYQERLYDSGEIGEVLRAAGLKRVDQEEVGEEQKRQGQDDHQVLDLEIKTGKEMSQRGEDLGMMDQRKFVVAVKPAL